MSSGRPILSMSLPDNIQSNTKDLDLQTDLRERMMVSSKIQYCKSTMGHGVYKLSHQLLTT